MNTWEPLIKWVLIDNGNLLKEFVGNSKAKNLTLHITSYIHA